ncbi:polyphenol oxidase family protein [Deferribacter thermophilus]|uniref:polyphenol oxidase family protein n=1 Tax=Deferribacter thermophilus TaxID=53573 RepID=UPI003C289B54
MQRDSQKLLLIKPKKLSSPYKIFTTTRLGGYSVGVYKSLNFGYFTGDDLINIEKNYEALKDYTGIKRIITLRQIHGSKVVVVDKNSASFKEGDALFTKAQGVGLGILTADCYSVQIVSKSGSIANLHCGWRSVYNGIIVNALRHFQDEKISNVVINVGICEKCFEVKDDFINLTKKVFNLDKNLRKLNGCYFFDLRSEIEDIFLENGIEKNIIEHIRCCPKCDENFYSYRREKVTGRMISMIVRD